MASLEQSQTGTGRRKGIFSKGVFIYDYDKDIFICPAGQILKRRKYKKKRKHYEYAATAKTCSSCHLKEKCTRSKTGRTIKRHVREDELDLMQTRAISSESKKDIRARQHLMERSFARITRYGYKRARWRRLWRVQIQEYLTAGIQNILTLLRNIKEPTAAAQMRVATTPSKQGNKAKASAALSLLGLIFSRLRQSCRILNADLSRVAYSNNYKIA